MLGDDWYSVNIKISIEMYNILFFFFIYLNSFSLGQMRSLRLFYSNKECTCGQLVIASRESQYKILHFHYGGLDKLAKIFEEYNFLSKSKNKVINNINIYICIFIHVAFLLSGFYLMCISMRYNVDQQ